MARPHKQGLDYFPLNTDFFDDDKIQLVSAEFGLKAEAVAVRLLALIYKNSYWYRWGNDECLLLAKRVGETGAFVSEVVKGLVRRSFFDERVFDSFQVLTSKGIQARYFEAIERRKEVDVWESITLFDVNPLMQRFNVSINQINASINPQSKRKVKGKESKEPLGADAPDEPAEILPPKKITPHWKKIKETWISFYKENYNGLEPTFNAGSASALKSIAERLQETSAKATSTALNEWTEDYAIKVFTHFLRLAISDEWRKGNFRLPLLSSHYDSIILKKPHEPRTSKNGKPATGAGVDPGSALSKLAEMYNQSP